MRRAIKKYRITPGLGAVAIYSPELHPCLDEKYPSIVFLQRRLLCVKAAGGMTHHEATINGPVVQPERGQEPPARQTSAGDVLELGCATGKGSRMQELVSAIPSLTPVGIQLLLGFLGVSCTLGILKCTECCQLLQLEKGFG